MNRTIPMPARVLVCGAVYGSSYLRALSGAHGGGARVVGILGRGGPASRAHAQRMGVPCFSGVDQVPAGSVDAACVAVGGDAGIELAEALLERGLPVISEHPLRAESVASLQAAAAARGVPWHLNSHFADLPCIEPLITGCRQLAASGPPLFVHATANPRTLFSLIDLLARALGPLGEPGWTTVPRVENARDFLGAVSGPLAGSAALISCQRTVSARDDGSATLVSHHLELAFPRGVLELADTHGPVLWRPNASLEGADGPLWSTWPAGPPPSLTLVQAQRDGANLAAVELLLHQARGASPPAHQLSAHQLEVATAWEALVAALDPPILLPSAAPAT
ncbi:MAG: Gfo/Idh/MocA family oxidoreductase [Holophagales bacterium]|nr:Gfo/Idh/MocA family oxidoreductase [Holophagales bacterium]